MLSAARPACRRTRTTRAAPASDDETALAGAEWQALQAALDDRAPFTATLRCVAQLTTGSNGALRTQLRVLLNYHCGVSTLRTRQMMRDLQAL